MKEFDRVNLRDCSMKFIPVDPKLTKTFVPPGVKAYRGDKTLLDLLADDIAATGLPTDEAIELIGHRALREFDVKAEQASQKARAAQEQHEADQANRVKKEAEPEKSTTTSTGRALKWVRSILVPKD